MQFQRWKMKHAIPHWKDNIKNLGNLSIQDHLLIKCNRILNLKKTARNSKNSTAIKIHVTLIIRKCLAITIPTGK